MMMTFARTTAAFLSGKKTQTRRWWSPLHLERWQTQWDRNPSKLHSAYDKNPRNGGKLIGQFVLRERPCYQNIGYMSEADFIEEGGYELWPEGIGQFVGALCRRQPTGHAYEPIMVKFAKIGDDMKKELL